MLPELDRIRFEHVAAPALGPRHLVAGQELLELSLEPVAALDRLALARGGSRGAGAGRARGPIRVGFLRRHPAHRPLDPNLAPERLPVDDERRARVLVELAALAALVAGEEREAALVRALQQEHARGRTPVGVRGRQRHSLRGRHSRSPRLLEPAVELRNRVVRQRNPCSSSSRTSSTPARQTASTCSSGSS